MYKCPTCGNMVFSDLRPCMRCGDETESERAAEQEHEQRHYVSGDNDTNYHPEEDQSF